ncbi:peptidase M13 [Asticcacaulis sp. AC460]|uniref:M13 family metallopeptidase n=1 Tax=Asticcacaulis sp. AC460 TaxID=1282360 RepID=UPI0003C3D2CE|nr:M13 family metallopeptidase [Asticcacaulis sp. AC460]ESQ92945.1 peptidase M13 [Asticcacaulis sp. AC460]
MRILKLLAVTTALAVVTAAPAFAVDNSLAAERTQRPLHGLEAFLAQDAGGTDLTAAPRFGAWGVDLEGMDTSVKPGDSFFRYANGKALDSMEIPADKTSYGVAYKLLDLAEARSQAIIEGLATRGDLSGDEAKIAAMYKSMLDTQAVEARDAAPLAPLLASIRGVKTRSDMAAWMGRSAGTFGSSFFGAYVAADEKNPNVNVVNMGQSGLGLPDRDYYLKDNFADKKAKYEIYVADMLRLVGYPDATQAAKDIVAMETKIAEVSWTRTERRDSTKMYNPFTRAELAKYAPGFDWAAYFKGAQLDTASKVVVGENTAFPKIAQVFADTPLETLKAWETFRTIDQAAPYLSERFVRTAWTFRSKELGGQQQQRPRWKRAISAVEGSLGMALGRAYVAEYFPPESKAKMEALVNDLLAAMKVRIGNLTWMSPDTKAKALEKLSKFGVKIGYPDKWRDYSGLTIDAGDLYGNMARSSAFDWAFQVSKVDKPVDPLEWGMLPQEVNAYYSPTYNEIVFPAAILQPPFFDPNADPAVNYGAIGGVIGHEISHGFDDQGRNYDGDGVLTDWWTAEDAAKFTEQATKLGAQYDAYEPVPDHKVQGGLTMGENLADLAGLLIALDAYHISLKGAEAPVLDGFTGDQRFFLAAGQVWRSKRRDATMIQLLSVDPHSPAEFRSIGPSRNIDAWYEAFKVVDGKYYLKPEDRVRIW